MYREEKREALREGKRKAEAVAAPAVSAPTPMDVVSPGKQSSAANGKAKKKTSSAMKKTPSVMKEGSSGKKRKTAK